MSNHAGAQPGHTGAQEDAPAPAPHSMQGFVTRDGSQLLVAIHLNHLKAIALNLGDCCPSNPASAIAFGYSTLPSYHPIPWAGCCDIDM